MLFWSAGGGDGIEAGKRGRREAGNQRVCRVKSAGAILAGGGATRFGGKPKGLEVVGGERILDRLARVMTDALGDLPLLVANASDAAEWRPDLRTVADVQPGFGALGGIYTAVIAAPAPVV